MIHFKILEYREKNIFIFTFHILFIIIFCTKNTHCSTRSMPATATTAINTAGCFDQGRDCPFREQLCNNSLYFDLMSWQCPWTCNRCPPGGAEPTRPPNIVNPPLPNKNCKDFIDCPTWVKNGFCSLYSNSSKADFCPISCQVGCAIGDGGNNFGG